MKLEISGLTKRYGTQAALDALDLHVTGGRVLVLVGPSGGGKSTLLRVLGGLEKADEGRVLIRGKELPSNESELLAYRRAHGFLFQQFNLFTHLNALRNLTLPLEEVHGMTPAQAKETAEAALHRFGLLAHAHKRPSQLSGGQQQRVGIARAVAAKPEVQELAESGQRIVLSTHEMGFARAVGDMVAFLAAGKVVEAATPAKWFEQPESEQGRKFLSRVLRYG